MYPKALRDLIEDLAKLPTIGEKTAERLALHLVTKAADEQLNSFSDHLKHLKQNIHTCPICGMLSDDTCHICHDSARDHKTIMVVADVKDVFSLEKMGSYRGLYHVLGGLIDFSRGIDHTSLNIDSLVIRLDSIDELIIATNGTVEGELTAQFLRSLLKEKKVIISRLGYGIPVGVDLRYADEKTLNKAVENRQKY